eukprot:jgi/Mesvir1/3579/Mv12042-RA.1
MPAGGKDDREISETTSRIKQALASLVYELPTNSPGERQPSSRSPLALVSTPSKDKPSPSSHVTAQRSTQAVPVSPTVTLVGASDRVVAASPASNTPLTSAGLAPIPTSIALSSPDKVFLPTSAAEVASLLTSSRRAKGGGPPPPAPARDASFLRSQLCRPWDRGDFLQRLATFRPSFWFGVPDAIGPVTCARYGWQCEGVYLLRCDCCDKRLCLPLSIEGGQGDSTQVIHGFRGSLSSGHQALCPWRDNSCAPDLARFPRGTAGMLRASAQERERCLLQLDALPLVDTDAVASMAGESGVGVGRLLGREAASASISTSMGGRPGGNGAEEQQMAAGGDGGCVAGHLSYRESLRLLSLCGWVARLLPFSVTPADTPAATQGGADSPPGTGAGCGVAPRLPSVTGASGSGQGGSVPGNGATSEGGASLPASAAATSHDAGTCHHALPTLAVPAYSPTQTLLHQLLCVSPLARPSGQGGAQGALAGGMGRMASTTPPHAKATTASATPPRAGLLECSMCGATVGLWTCAQGPRRPPELAPPPDAGPATATSRPATLLPLPGTLPGGAVSGLLGGRTPSRGPMLVPSWRAPSAVDADDVAAAALGLTRPLPPQQPPQQAATMPMSPAACSGGATVPEPSTPTSGSDRTSQSPKARYLGVGAAVLFTPVHFGMTIAGGPSVPPSGATPAPLTPVFGRGGLSSRPAFGSMGADAASSPLFPPLVPDASVAAAATEPARDETAQGAGTGPVTPPGSVDGAVAMVGGGAAAQGAFGVGLSPVSSPVAAEVKAGGTPGGGKKRLHGELGSSPATVTDGGLSTDAGIGHKNMEVDGASIDAGASSEEAAIGMMEGDESSLGTDACSGQGKRRRQRAPGASEGADGAALLPAVPSLPPFHPLLSHRHFCPWVSVYREERLPEPPQGGEDGHDQGNAPGGMSSSCVSEDATSTGEESRGADPAAGTQGDAGMDGGMSPAVLTSPAHDADASGGKGGTGCIMDASTPLAGSSRGLLPGWLQLLRVALRMPWALGGMAGDGKPPSGQGLVPRDVGRSVSGVVVAASGSGGVAGAGSAATTGDKPARPEEQRREVEKGKRAMSSIRSLLGRVTKCKTEQK